MFFQLGFPMFENVKVEYKVDPMTRVELRLSQIMTSMLYMQCNKSTTKKKR